MLTIIVFSYKYPDHLYKCLESINRAFPQGSCEIIVTENGPPSEETMEVASKFGARLVSQDEDNIQTCGFINEAIDYALSDDIMTISQDMMVDKNFYNIIQQNRFPEENMMIYSQLYFLSAPDKSGKAYIHSKAPRNQICTIDEYINHITVYDPSKKAVILDISKMVTPWSVADGLNIITKKSIFLKHRFYENETDISFQYSIVEWLFRIWYNDVKFKYCPDLIITHQFHPNHSFNRNKNMYMETIEEYEEKEKMFDQGSRFYIERMVMPKLEKKIHQLLKEGKIKL